MVSRLFGDSVSHLILGRVARQHKYIYYQCTTSDCLESDIHPAPLLEVPSTLDDISVYVVSLITQ
jgi:hypothetical protein